MTRDREIKNAKITSTTLGTEDHGIVSMFVHLDYSGSGQGFGGFCLDTPIEDASGKFLRREGTAWGMEFIMRVLATVGVERWEQLPGKYVRADAEWGTVHRIGHITEDKWFDPKVDLAHLEDR